MIPDPPVQNLPASKVPLIAIPTLFIAITFGAVRPSQICRITG